MTRPTSGGDHTAPKTEATKQTLMPQSGDHTLEPPFDADVPDGELEPIYKRIALRITPFLILVVSDNSARPSSLGCGHAARW